MQWRYGREACGVCICQGKPCLDCRGIGFDDGDVRIVCGAAIDLLGGRSPALPLTEARLGEALNEKLG